VARDRLGNSAYRLSDRNQGNAGKVVADQRQNLKKVLANARALDAADAFDNLIVGHPSTSRSRTALYSGL
jgi:hypothetical protein